MLDSKTRRKLRNQLPKNDSTKYRVESSKKIQFYQSVTDKDKTEFLEENFKYKIYLNGSDTMANWNKREEILANRIKNLWYSRYEKNSLSNDQSLIIEYMFLDRTDAIIFRLSV
jgi:Na+-transporting NADH:ubiquinone oxidoreductase subunit NqrF